MTTLSLSHARRMIEKSVAAADATNVACSIAIIDQTGCLVSFVRQDAAMSGSAELAIDKAFTAQIFNNRTDALAHCGTTGHTVPGRHAGSTERQRSSGQNRRGLACRSIFLAQQRSVLRDDGLDRADVRRARQTPRSCCKFHGCVHDCKLARRLCQSQPRSANNERPVCRGQPHGHPVARHHASGGPRPRPA